MVDSDKGHHQPARAVRRHRRRLDAGHDPHVRPHVGPGRQRGRHARGHPGLVVRRDLPGRHRRLPRPRRLRPVDDGLGGQRRPDGAGGRGVRLPRQDLRDPDDRHRARRGHEGRRAPRARRVEGRHLAHVPDQGRPDPRLGQAGRDPGPRQRHPGDLLARRGPRPRRQPDREGQRVPPRARHRGARHPDHDAGGRDRVLAGADPQGRGHHLGHRQRAARLPHRPVPDPRARHQRQDAVGRAADQRRWAVRDRRRRLGPQARAAAGQGELPALGQPRRVPRPGRELRAPRADDRQRAGPGPGRHPRPGDGDVPRREQVARPQGRLDRQPRLALLPGALLGPGAGAADRGRGARRGLHGARRGAGVQRAADHRRADRRAGVAGRHRRLLPAGRREGRPRHAALEDAQRGAGRSLIRPTARRPVTRQGWPAFGVRGRGVERRGRRGRGSGGDGSRPARPAPFHPPAAAAAARPGLQRRGARPGPLRRRRPAPAGRRQRLVLRRHPGPRPARAVPGRHGPGAGALLDGRRRAPGVHLRRPRPRGTEPRPDRDRGPVPGADLRRPGGAGRGGVGGRGAGAGDGPAGRLQRPRADGHGQAGRAAPAGPAGAGRRGSALVRRGRDLLPDRRPCARDGRRGPPDLERGPQARGHPRDRAARHVRRRRPVHRGSTGALVRAGGGGRRRPAGAAYRRAEPGGPRRPAAPRRRRPVPGRRQPVVPHPLRARLVVGGPDAAALRHRAGAVDAARAGRPPGPARRPDDRGAAGQDPARGARRRPRPRRAAAAAALLRHRRRDAAVRQHARGRPRLGRGPRAGRRAAARRPTLPGVGPRPVRRLRLAALRRPHGPRAVEPGLEGQPGRRAVRRRPVGRGADRALRGAGVRLRGRRPRRRAPRGLR